MQVIELLLANLDEAYDRKGWQGTTLRGSLRGLTPQQALWRPADHAHNIWEYVLHAAYWKYAVHRRLTGAKRQSFALKGSNFFAVPADARPESWRNSLLLLDEMHKQVRATIAALRPRDLADARKRRMAYGIAAHDVYHTGQIQLLKRLQK